jgi:hypothetical protein
MDSKGCDYDGPEAYLTQISSVEAILLIFHACGTCNTILMDTLAEY